MIAGVERHAAVYLGTRVFAALCNMLALVLFTRLAVPAVFGDYLLGFACGVAMGAVAASARGKQWVHAVPHWLAACVPLAVVLLSWWLTQT